MQIDDSVIRVTRWDFEPEAETGDHRHDFAYVVVPLTTGNLQIDSAAGSLTSPLVVGVSYNRPAGAEHNVINASGGPFSFVEIELLDQPG